MNVSLVAFPNPKNTALYCGLVSVQFTAADLANGASLGGSSAGFSLLAEVGGQWAQGMNCILSTDYQGHTYMVLNRFMLPPNQQLLASDSPAFLHNNTPPGMGSMSQTLQWDGVAGVGVFNASFSFPIS